MLSYLPRCSLVGHAVSEENICLEIGQSEAKIACGAMLTDRDEKSNLHRAPYKDASFKVSVQLTKVL
jgi:hypothetical protein